MASKKCSSEGDDPPEARTRASKKNTFEVDDPPEARTWAPKMVRIGLKCTVRFAASEFPTETFGFFEKEK